MSHTCARCGRRLKDGQWIFSRWTGQRYCYAGEWDADWQDWSVESLGAGVHRLSLYVTKDMLQVARAELEARA